MLQSRTSFISKASFTVLELSLLWIVALFLSQVSVFSTLFAFNFDFRCKLELGIAFLWKLVLGLDYFMIIWFGWSVFRNFGKFKLFDLYGCLKTCRLLPSQYLMEEFFIFFSMLVDLSNLYCLIDGSIPAIKLATYRRRLNSGTEVGFYTCCIFIDVYLSSILFFIFQFKIFLSNKFCNLTKAGHSRWNKLP